MEQQRIVNELNAMESDREAKAAELGSIFSGPTDVMTLRLYSNFLSGRDEDIELKKKELLASLERLKKKQLELQEYVKRKRVLEVLKERKLATHAREEHRKERILMDEVAANIWFKEAL